MGHFNGHSSFNHFHGGFNHFHGSNFYFRPYAFRYYNYPFFYGYPSYYYNYPYYYSYPSDYYAYGDDDYYGDVPQYYDYPPPQQYAVSRPVADVARMEVLLPDPDGTLWVQGQQMKSTGTVRHFRSPQLDPSQQYTYNVKAEWNDNGKLVTDERQVKVQANGLAVVDFTRPTGASADLGGATLPPLPPPARQTE
jgi:uncharacterized protein (TIGR03000 family)